MGCVYVITCHVNGKQYVGATTETKAQRFARHCCPEITDYQGSRIQPTIKKYGKENFSIKAIFHSPDWTKLCAVEVRAIKRYNTRWPSGYNMTDGGDGRVGVKWSKKQASEIPKAIKKHWQNPKSKAKAIAKMKETLSTPEVKAKLRKAARERWNIPGYRENFSKKSKATWAKPENKKKMSERSKNMWKDPKHGKIHKKRLEKMWNRPGQLEKHKKVMKRYWKNKKK